MHDLESDAVLMFLPFYSVPIILVGNKTDLHVDRRVTQEQGKNLAAEMKAAFIETSAKENQVCSLDRRIIQNLYLNFILPLQNVEDIFRRVIAQMENLDRGAGEGEEKKCVVMWLEQIAYWTYFSRVQNSPDKSKM